MDSLSRRDCAGSRSGSVMIELLGGIDPTAGGSGLRRLRVGILLDEPVNRRLDYVVEFEHELAEAGHVVFHPPRAMSELGLDVARVAAMVEKF